MSRNRRPEALAAATAEPSLDETSPFAGPFAAGYERWFDPLYAYVSRHVASRGTRERIVRQVLAENLDLLVGQREEAVETRRLQATADRLIADVVDVVDEADQFLEQRRRERLARSHPG